MPPAATAIGGKFIDPIWFLLPILGRLGRQSVIKVVLRAIKNTILPAEYLTDSGVWLQHARSWLNTLLISNKAARRMGKSDSHGRD